MSATEVKYPLKLCVELLSFSFWSCDKTKDLRTSEIKQLVGNFFTEEEIEAAVKILHGGQQ